MKYGHWITVSDVFRSATDRYVKVIKCRCICGNEGIVRIGDLKRGKSTNCGCKRKPKRTHGMSKSRTYGSWRSMKERCLSKSSKIYKYYGGRGIKFCERWRDFPNFLEDMGEKPPGTSLERIDVNGNYEPSNCKWISVSLQPKNTRRNVFIEYQGKRLILQDWARIYNMPQSTLWRRLYTHKMPIDVALTKKVKPCGRARKIKS